MEDEDEGGRGWIQFFKRKGSLYSRDTKSGAIMRVGTLQDVMDAIEKGKKRRASK